MGRSSGVVAEITYLQLGGAQQTPSLFKRPHDAGDTRSKESPWPGPAAEAAMEPVSSCWPFPAPGWDPASSPAVPRAEQAPLQVTSPRGFAVLTLTHSDVPAHMLTQGHILLILSFVAALHPW